MLYDEQCVVCQAGVAWVRFFDRLGATECRPVQRSDVQALHPDLDELTCLRDLHLVTAEGEVLTNWPAVRHLLGVLPAFAPVARLAATRAGSRLGERITRAVTESRWELIRARGGIPHHGVEPRPLSPFGPFWACYTAELLLRLPIVLAATVSRQLGQVGAYAQTWGRQVHLLDDRLTICFLSGLPTAVVPILFGERFTLCVYDGVAVDPGATRMRRSIDRHLAHLARRGPTIDTVTATHAHEEHVGNLDWLAERTGARLVVPSAVARQLDEPYRLPWWRKAVIGDIPPLSPLSAEPVDDRLPTRHGALDVLPAPGHSSDHVVFHDPDEGVLLAGDTFLGAYFSTPNEDVDGDALVTTLERLLDLDISVLVEAHGHVHTQRADVPDVPGVVVRQDPKQALRRKLDWLTGVRAQVARGRADGLSERAIEATCFPWGAAWSLESKGSDEIARLLTGGRFSRTQVVRSFPG